MKPTASNFVHIGPRLTGTFAFLILLILGGNGLLLWQFQTARLQTDHLTGVNQQLIAVLRLQESLLVFRQRLNELARSQDRQRFASETEPLRGNLLEQTRRTRSGLTHLASGTAVDPVLMPTLDAIEITLATQLEAISELAKSGDWDSVRRRLGTELKPLETQTSALVDHIDQQVSGEVTQAEGNMGMAQSRILIIVPATAILTFFTAAFFGWSIARRIIELRLDERITERMRITRELHDTFLQTIQGSKLLADDALEESSDSARMRRAMEQLSVWLGQATQEGRAALNSLRTSTTLRNDLAEALRRATEECRMWSPLEVAFSVTGDSKEIHPVVRDEIYRIGYEAVRNACAHSHGSRLEVELTYAHDLTIRVADNGAGIDASVLEQGRDGHFGLQGMRDRATRIGGKLAVVSSPNSGTEITVVVPGRIVFRKASERPIEKIRTSLDGLS